MSKRSNNTKISIDSDKRIDDYKPLITKWILGIGIILFLIYFRSPILFFEPRFWAEEGQGYFSYAFSHSILKSLIAPHYGYFGLIPNLGGILATFVPLEIAPLVTTSLAALVQFTVSAYVIFSDSPYWDTFLKKLVIACSIQLLCPCECWLTTISSQYFLSIIAFFILVDTNDVQNSWMKWPSRILLSISSLTSPAVMFLLPAFILKSFKTRLREDWLRVFILSIGALLQVIAFIQTYLNANSQLSGRFNSDNFNLLKIIILHLSESMIGTYYLKWFNFFGIDTGVVRISLIIFVLYMLYLLIKSVICKQLQLHALAFILLTVPVVLLSQGMRSSSRAAFAPAIILITVMVYEFGNRENRLFFRGVSIFTLSGVFLFGILTHDMKVYFTDSPLPVWKDEVNIWRQDNDHLLRIWPQYAKGEPNPWYVKLETRIQKDPPAPPSIDFKNR